MKETSIDAHVFIIPNSACTISEFSLNSTKNYLKSLYELNDITFNENDKAVQVWLTDTYKGDPHVSDSFTYNGFTAVVDSNVEWLLQPSIQWMPYELIKDCREGNIIDIKVPYFSFKMIDGKLQFGSDIGECYEMIINLSMTCNQKGYKYSEFGNFEKLLQRVIK